MDLKIGLENEEFVFTAIPAAATASSESEPYQALDQKSA